MPRIWIYDDVKTAKVSGRSVIVSYNDGSAGKYPYPNRSIAVMMCSKIFAKDLEEMAKSLSVPCTYEGNGMYMIRPKELELRGLAGACLSYLNHE